MFFVYILKSKKDDKLYIGCTNDLRKRIREHNLGLVRSTSPRKPFYLVYYEAYLSKQDAFRREHNLKLRAKTLRQLKNRIDDSLKA
ncbi:MAG: Excinuclease ABC C subunit domain protein [Parcubacteria group bacterium GW2011_GWC1_38_6]|nr:MAG: Excinuclease ABC C subunit domain protein [Parcubacteria group bacterium GW2011_GWC1_38_6]